MEGSHVWVWTERRNRKQRGEAKRGRKDRSQRQPAHRLLHFFPIKPLRVHSRRRVCLPFATLSIHDVKVVMKCRRHPHEVGVGFCASCLRERLLAVIAARSAVASSSSPDDHRRPGLSYVESEEPSPQPLPRPRSDFPYVSHLRSDASVVASFPDANTGNAVDAPVARSGKLSVFSTLFGHHRPDNSLPDPDPAARIRRSRSWLPALIRGSLVKRGDDNNKKKTMARFFSADDPYAAAAATVAARPRARDRGMSPDRGNSAQESDYNTPSPGGRRWHQTPSPLRRVTAEHQHHFSGGLAGFSLCLSPLMRPSPARRRGHIGAEASGGDLPRTLSPLHHHGHASGGWPSLRPNRSRKPAESGKFK